MLSSLQEKFGFNNGLQISSVEALSVAADLDIARREGEAHQDWLFGRHPIYGRCVVVLRVVGACYLLFDAALALVA